MAHTFSDDDNDDLIERGFEVEQIHYLESLEMDPEELYSDICKQMDDFGDTPEQIIEFYQNNLPDETQNNFSSQGGKRKRRNQSKRRTKTKRRTKSKKRKQRKTRRRIKRNQCKNKSRKRK